MKLSRNSGFVDDGSADLGITHKLVAIDSVKNSAKLMIPVVLPTVVSGSIYPFPEPGFYFVWASGSNTEGWFTGSVPSAASYPGARMIVSNGFTGGPVFNFGWALTGSAWTKTAPVFTMPICALSGPYNTAVQRRGGTFMNVSGSSVIMISDGIHWCICGGSGTIRLSGRDDITIP